MFLNVFTVVLVFSISSAWPSCGPVQAVSTPQKGPAETNLIFQCFAVAGLCGGARHEY